MKYLITTIILILVGVIACQKYRYSLEEARYYKLRDAYQDQLNANWKLRDSISLIRDSYDHQIRTIYKILLKTDYKEEIFDLNISDTCKPFNLNDNLFR